MEWPVIYRRKIRYSDVDSQAIVFNGNYLSYYDDAITDLFEAAALSPAAMHAAGFDVLTVHAEIDFTATAGVGDLLLIGARVVRLGNTSVTFELESWVAGDDRVTTRGTVVWVCVDAGSHEPIPVPAILIDAFKAIQPDLVD